MRTKLDPNDITDFKRLSLVDGGGEEEEGGREEKVVDCLLEGLK